MKRILALLLLAGSLWSQSSSDYFAEDKEIWPREEFTFIGYYFMRSERGNVAPTNEFLKGQVVGRLFGGNTTKTSQRISAFTEQRFIPIIAYSPRLFDGWATMRMSYELDWTWGDANYGAGGNFGGAFGADFVNMQTQNLFIEFRPKRNIFINAGLTRLFDNVRVPAYTFTSTLLNTGYRLAFWGSDASGLAGHYYGERYRLKAGVYQLYENNVDQHDDVLLHELHAEYDLDIVNSVGATVWYLKDRANGEGGVSILGQGLNSGLSNYNGVYNFNFGGEPYDADIIWLGTHFHGNPLLNQGRFGYNGFAVLNTGSATSESHDVDIMGYAANLRLGYKYGRTHNDHIALDGIFTSGDKSNIEDGKYTGVLTGNNWTAPGAVFISHGLYLLLPHGNVVNRFNGAVVDIQNIGYGLVGGSLTAAYDVVPNTFRVKVGAGAAASNVSPVDGGSMVGSEINLNLRYTPKVFMDIELHAAYMQLGDFFESPVTNGGIAGKPKDPWTAFLTFKWIMF